MARIRSIHPSFKHDPKVKRLSRDARLTFVLMWCEADDEGRMPGSGKWLAGTLFEDDDDVTPAKVSRWLGELVREGMVQPYEVDGARYLHIVNFHRYQHPKRRSPSRLPAPPCTPPCTPPMDPTERISHDPPSDPSSTPTTHPPEVGGRSKEVGSRSSSSSVSDLQPPPEPAEEEDPEVDAEVERRYRSSVAAGTNIGSVRAWKAKTRAHVLAEVAEAGRGVLKPSPARPSDPLEKTAAASRARAKRNDARAHGEACAACEGTGFVLGDDDVAVVCQQCSGAAAAVGQ